MHFFDYWDPSLPPPHMYTTCYDALGCGKYKIPRHRCIHIYSKGDKHNMARKK